MAAVFYALILTLGPVVVSKEGISGADRLCHGTGGLSYVSVRVKHRR